MSPSDALSQENRDYFLKVDGIKVMISYFNI